LKRNKLNFCKAFSISAVLALYTQTEISAEYQTSEMLQGYASKSSDAVIESNMWNQFEKNKLSWKKMTQVIN
jgi:hypothetical protein